MDRNGGNYLSSRGVTLIELMIVVVIIGILSAVAYPSYQKWTTESNRSDAHAALVQLSNELEKFYSECSAYTNRITSTPRSCTAPAASGSLAAGTLGKSSDLSPNQNYQMSITLSSTGYTITATPRGKQLAKDTDCGSLSLTNAGVKTASGTSTGRCWRK